METSEIEKLRLELEQLLDDESDPLMCEYFQTAMGMCEFIDFGRFDPESIKDG